MKLKAPPLLLTVLLVGLSGLVAQVLLLRELLVSFFGNELTLGIILGNWLALEALGTFLIGRLADRAKNPATLFIFLQIIFSLFLPLCLYSARTAKLLFGVPSAEAIGLGAIFLSSCLVILPVAFSHGALFSLACKMYSSQGQKSASLGIGAVYAWETIGTLLGAVAFTYFFLPRWDSFQIAGVISGINLLICIFFFRGKTNFLKYLYPVILGLWGIFVLSAWLGIPQRSSLGQLWPHQKVLEYSNSVYGNVAVVKERGQYTFFYNGIPAVVTPYPDAVFVEEFGNLPLLFHPEPKNILIIGAGAGGIIRQALKYDLEQIDYAELDPLLIKLLQKYPSALTEAELTDMRVKIIYRDGRFFLKNTRRKYDLILIGLSRPMDLTINRLFTQEFFLLAKKKLSAGGILSFCLPGSYTYLSQQLRDLNACIGNALAQTYSHVRIIPGDYNMFLAADTPSLMQIEAKDISQRIAQRHIKTSLLVPQYLSYRLDPQWLDWFRRASRGATKKANRDFLPFAVYEMLVIWNRQFWSFGSVVLENLKNINFSVVLFIILLIAASAFVFSRKRKNFPVIYAIATTGFFGMLINLVLLFGFQVTYGYLYHMLALLSGLFMAGVAAGSIVSSRLDFTLEQAGKIFLKIDWGIILLSLSVGLFLPKIEGQVWIFFFLFLICGVALGAQFPLAVRMYLGQHREIGRGAGVLYAADLIGGWLAGILGGVVFLPLLGLLETCLIIILLKTTSLILLSRTYP